jgi:drug/metabolite transporter (DMT)-like permease
MIWLSILLIAICALAWDAGVVLQKRAADALPPLALGSGLGKTLLRFLRSPGWMAGMLVSALGWGLFAYALSFTPVSLARALQGLGFVVLAFLSVIYLQHRLTAWEWVGVAAVTLGVLLLGLSEPRGHVAPVPLDPARVSVGLAAALGTCGVLFLATLLSRLRHFGLVLTAAIAGVLLGLGDVLTRVLLLVVSGNPMVALGAVGPLLAGAYLTGFFTLSRSYQHGRAIVATAVSDLAARLVTLLVGVLALQEALPVDSTLKAARIIGFGLIFVGTGVLAHFSAEGLDSQRSSSGQAAGERRKA